MAIQDAPFEAEQELQRWAFENCATFFGDCIFLPGFRISTPAGKQGVPDGFAFNLVDRAWWVVECELLHHGVWPHIAEQLTRFVVAARNAGTLRQLRDRLFERIMEAGKHEQVISSLNTTPHRLLQQIEVFVESVSPSLAVFIDETNQDLNDFCNALDIPTEVFRVRKFVVNGKTEYYSPDKNTPVLKFDTPETSQEGSAVFDAIEQLGGGEVVSGKHKCYKLTDGRTIAIRYSRFHERNNAFWYGISPSSLEQLKGFGCSEFVFVLGDEGFAVVPISVVESYITHTAATKNADGTVRHYHVHISPPPDIVLKGLGDGDDISISKLFQVFS